MKIEVLGSGCQKCQKLAANAKEAAAALHIDAEVQHVTDPVEIAKRGVMSTPALAINDRVVSKGKVMSAAEIQPLLQG